MLQNEPEAKAHARITAFESTSQQMIDGQKHRHGVKKYTRTWLDTLHHDRG